MRRLILAAVLLAACGRETAMPPAGISRETFITVYAELSRARLRTTPDEFSARKEEILKQHGVTERDLTRFVEVHGQQPAYMAELWNSVRERLAGNQPEAQRPQSPFLSETTVSAVSAE